MSKQPRYPEPPLPFEKLMEVAERERRALDEVIAIVRRHHSAEVAVRAATVSPSERCTFH